MDNVTHTLAGAALGHAGLKRLSGMAMGALMIGANLPDIDALALLFDSALTFRRGWTHGVVGMALLPVALTAALIGWDRWQGRRGKRPARRAPVRPRQLLLLSYAGVLSHPFLDWLNTYGVRLLMPFSHDWFHGDAVFIIDPWILLALGLGVFLSWGRARLGKGTTSKPARLALAGVGIYIGLMLLTARSAREIAAQHMIGTGQRAPLRVMAGPVPLNPLARELIYDMGGSYRFGRLDWRRGGEVTLGMELPTNLRHPDFLRIASHPEVRDFLYWSRFPFAVIYEEADTTAVRLADARFRWSQREWNTVDLQVRD